MIRIYQWDCCTLGLLVMTFVTAPMFCASFYNTNPLPYPNTVVTGLIDFNMSVRITVIRNGLFRLQLQRTTDKLPDSEIWDDRATFSIINRRFEAIPEFQQNVTEKEVTVTTSASQLHVSSNSTVADYINIQFECQDKAVWNWSHSPNNSIPPQQSMPINADGFYVLDDSNTSRLGGGNDGNIDWWLESSNNIDIYFLCYGIDTELGMQQFTTITGKPSILPLAAYGVWYSGCCIPSLYNSSAVRTLLLAEYRRQDLPLDVFVFDFFWHRKSTGWGGYSWEDSLFPDHEVLVAEFRNGSNPYGSKIITLNNHHPNSYVIEPSSEDRYVEFAMAMGDDPKNNFSYPCNFYNRTYIQALQQSLLASVEDYPWIDCVSCTTFGDCGDERAPKNLDFNLLTNYAFHAMYALQNQRGLVLNRLPGRADGSNYNPKILDGDGLKGNLGSHRYPAAWTGDTGTGAKVLSDSVALFAESCAGYLWCAYSLDLGLYADGLDEFNFPTNGVRFVRNVQFGVFTAIFRPHDGGNDDTRIWKFTEPYASILRDFTRLRGALTPYIYFLAWQSWLHSWPFIRPMWFDYGHNKNGSLVDIAWNVSHQYMFGRDIIVSPITVWSVNGDMNSTAIDIVNKTTWLPQGVWLSWNASRIFNITNKPSFITTIATLNEIPLFVRANTVLAMWPPGRRTSPPWNRTRMFTVWLQQGGNGRGQFYEDDGTSLDYYSGDGVTSTLAFNASKDLSTARIRITSPENIASWAPNHRTYAIQMRVHGGIANIDNCVVYLGSDVVSLSPTKVADWTSPGWWLVHDVEQSEMALTMGAAIIVLPKVNISGIVDVAVSLALNL